MGRSKPSEMSAPVQGSPLEVTSVDAFSGRLATAFKPPGMLIALSINAIMLICTSNFNPQVASTKFLLTLPEICVGCRTYR